MKYKMLNKNSLFNAMAECFKRLENDSAITAAAHSAGFSFPEKDGEAPKYQVFVKVCKYSEARLKENPISGGLLSESAP
jgi:hypothetical protein